MSRSGTGILDTDLEGVELLFHWKGDQLVLVPKWRCLWMEWIGVVWTQLLYPLVEQSAQISYTIHITIVNDDSSIISKWCSKLWHHLQALLMTVTKAKSMANKTFIGQTSFVIIKIFFSAGHWSLRNGWPYGVDNLSNFIPPKIAAEGLEL